MEQNRLRELEEQCIQDCAPPCTSFCPVHVDIRQMVRAILQEDFAGGLKIFTKSVPFPEIIARTCNQPCQLQCNRDSTGGVIQVADLEWACVQYGGENPSKVTVLPAKKARIAVIGAGLSGLTAAFELSKKGYQVSLFEEKTQLGGCLWNLPEEELPRPVIERETNLITRVGVDIRLGRRADPKQLFSEEFDAVYLGIGKQGSIEFDLQTDRDGTIQIDPITFQTSRTNVFGGGSMLHVYSSILSISDGRRAAISIDRFLQNVTLTASRVNEGAYQTRLVTNISNVLPTKVILPAQRSNGYIKKQAITEAERCLLCECMECVKACEYLRHYGSYPKKYVREIYNNLSLVMSNHTGNKFINSCTLCGLCGEVCPTDLNMGTVNHEVRQTMVKTGKMPISAHDFALRDMAFSNNEKAAVTLCPDDSRVCSYLFFPGCQLTASNPEYIPQLYQTLSSVFPDMGVMLRCCGAPADWSGEEEIFRKSMQELKDQWQALGKPKLVLACSSCNQILKKHLPDVETISVWEVFEQHQLFPKGRGFGKEFVIHDPCSSRYEAAWQNSARAGLISMGIPFHELAMSRNMTECCGYGGVVWLAHPELVKDIIQRRVGEDPTDYLTYCVMCRDLFAREGKRTLHLLDIIYGADLELLATRKGPDYSQRHENRIRVKQKMLKVLSGKDQFEVESYENYPLVLTPEMRTRIESRLILVEDIQKVIEHAETSGERFINQDNGHSLAYFKPNLITYWVEYTRANDAYQVQDAYSHRMDFVGDASA